MEFTQWGSLALASVAIMTLGWTAYQSLNRRAVAHNRASNLLNLAKTLGELDASVMSEKEIEEKKVLHERSLEVGFFYTQLYVSAVAPQLTSYLLPWIIMGGAIAALIAAPLQEPLTGSYGDGLSILFALVSPFLFFVASGFAFMRVERNKIVLRNLEKPAHLFLQRDVEDRSSTVSRFHKLMLFAERARSNAGTGV